MNSIEHIILKTELSQSDVFGEQYEEMLNNSNSSAFSNPLVEDLSELLNNIMVEYEALSEFQREMLNNIFNEFNSIRINIDPNRLKSFQHYYTEDSELLLYRDTPKGLINLIINPDECVAFSFLPYNDGQRRLYFIYPEGDFEKLALDFFSY